MEESPMVTKSLYVWDFDETILRIHAYGLRIAAEDVPTRVLEGKDGDAADLQFFQAAVAAVLARGDAVAVASFGCYDVICAYLERMCPGVFSRDNISTPSCVGVPDGCSVPGGKNPQLELLLGALLASEGSDASSLEAHRHRVVFFDDSVQNVTLARAAGYSRSFVVPRGGFTREAWLGLLREPHADTLVRIAI